MAARYTGITYSACERGGFEGVVSKKRAGPYRAGTRSGWVNGEDDRPLFAFPGIWRDYSGPIKKDGESIAQRVFAFMTCGPNALETAQYHERMPVLLGEAQFDTWLKGTTQEAMALARPYPAERMTIVQSGYDKQDNLLPA